VKPVRVPLAADAQIRIPFGPALLPLRAVIMLALASPLAMDLSVELPGRPPAPVESAVYFALTEILTNVTKHSAATSAWVRINYHGGRLDVMVADNGMGGAGRVPGGGLDGIGRRLAAFDGTVTVASPVGGPTIITLEVPCRLASGSS